METADEKVEKENGWTKYLNVLGLLGLLSAIIYVNPLAVSPSAITSVLKRSTSFSPPIIFEAEDPFESLAEEYRTNGCPNHQFISVKRVSRIPDIVLIEGFLTKEEADFLVHAAYFPIDHR
jgi:hypothetical protein